MIGEISFYFYIFDYFFSLANCNSYNFFNLILNTIITKELDDRTMKHFLSKCKTLYLQRHRS